MAIEGEVEWSRHGASPGEAGGRGEPRGGPDQPAESASDGEGDAPAAPGPRWAAHFGRIPRTSQLPAAAVGRPMVPGTLAPRLAPLRTPPSGCRMRLCAAPLVGLGAHFTWVGWCAGHHHQQPRAPGEVPGHAAAAGGGGRHLDHPEPVRRLVDGWAAPRPSSRQLTLRAAWRRGADGSTSDLSLLVARCTVLLAGIPKLRCCITRGMRHVAARCTEEGM